MFLGVQWLLECEPFMSYVVVCMLPASQKAAAAAAAREGVLTLLDIPGWANCAAAACCRCLAGC
jgi:hypothetical protein